MPLVPELVLASGSPRRRELLSRLGLPFEVIASDVDETFEPDISPAEMVVRLAERKARAVAKSHLNAVVIGADTTVVLDELVLNKPVDDGDATRMLRLLRGRAHRVLTGIAVVGPSGRVETGVVESGVRMRRYSDGAIAAYVATGEPLDKAGGYAIQGGAGVFVERIDGCFFNVVGLPLCELTRLFIRIGVEVAARACELPDGRPCPRLGAEG